MNRPEDFWARVNKTDTCWLWTGNLGETGYAQVKWHNRNRMVHHVALLLQGIELHLTPYPEWHVDHLCKVRHCVNPDHLRIIRAGDHIREHKGPAKVYCIRGHHKEGLRYCKECMKAASKRAYEKRKADRTAARIAREAGLA